MDGSQPTISRFSTTPAPVPKHFLAAFFLSFFLGIFGADRFYLGKYWSGAAKLITFGGFGIGAIVDLALIMNGAMHDAHDRPLAGYEEYKKLARKTVAWILFGTIALTVVSSLAIGIAIQLLISQLPSTDWTKLVPGAGTGGATGSSSLYGLPLQ